MKVRSFLLHIDNRGEKMNTKTQLQGCTAASERVDIGGWFIIPKSQLAGTRNRQKQGTCRKTTSF